MPEVRAIYKIVSTWTNEAKYDQYLSVSLILADFFALIEAHDYSNRVEAEGNFSAQGKSRGNEDLRWHGTTRECNIGDEGVKKYCSSPSCSLCCIMKTSSGIAFPTNFGKFGTGIYTSSTSSKLVLDLIKIIGGTALTVVVGFTSSDCYSQNGCASEWKAMLLNKVVVGRGYKMKSENTTLTSPPVGYDSVSTMVV